MRMLFGRGKKTERQMQTETDEQVQSVFGEAVPWKT
jgi:hypothetical protein